MIYYDVISVRVRVYIRLVAQVTWPGKTEDELILLVQILIETSIHSFKIGLGHKKLYNIFPIQKN